MHNFIVKENFPKYNEINDLFSSIGWELRPKKVLKQNKKSSDFCVSIYDEGFLVGMGRVVGDGCYYTLFDITVKKTYQGKSIGKIIVENLLSQIEEKAFYKNYQIYLICDKNKEEFFEKFKFKKCPNDKSGHGMTFLK